MGSETIESEAIYFPVTNAQHASDAAGGYASVAGEAIHAPGAGVKVNDEFSVTIPEVGNWPDDGLGKTVTVKGRIQAADGGGFLFEKILYEVEGEYSVMFHWNL